MKYKIILSLLLIIPLSTTCSQPQKVMICRSSTSYAYHKKMCQGLKKCTHKIETVLIETARQAGYKKACGYCYKK